MAQKDVYPNIEPLYSRYARGKYKTLPNGLSPRSFYKIMVACAERRGEGVEVVSSDDIEAAIESVGVTADDIQGAVDSPTFHSEVPEIQWLTSGRREFRPSDDLLVALGSVSMDMTFRLVANHVETLPDRTSVFRLAFPRAAKFGFAGAYMVLHPVKGTEQILVGLRMIDNVDPILRNPTSFILLRFFIDKPIELQMGACVAEMKERGIDEGMARLTGTVLRLGVFAEALSAVDHRLLVKQQRGALSAARDKRQKGSIAYWPEVISIESPVRQPGGEQFFEKPGRVYCETHPDGEVQLMIEWPS